MRDSPLSLPGHVVFKRGHVFDARLRVGTKARARHGVLGLRPEMRQGLQNEDTNEIRSH